MSGVFLIVEEKDRKPDESLLQATRGGYPHVTLVYTKQPDLKPTHLFIIGMTAISQWSLKHCNGQLPELLLLAENAHVNSFYEERTQKQRYDVLLGLRKADNAIVESLRKDLVTPMLDTTHAVMRAPHVTHSIHYNEEDAEETLKTLHSHMPIAVNMTGFTID